jgi:hypothetical protein
MQTNPGTDMNCDMIRPKGISRPEGTVFQTKPSTVIRRLDKDMYFFWRARRRFVR